MCKYSKITALCTFKWVRNMAYKLYLNKAVIEKKWKGPRRMSGSNISQKYG